MAFSEELLSDGDFLYELRAAQRLARKLSEKLEALIDDWELEEDDEDLLNDLCEQADALQHELYESCNEEE